MSDVPAGPPPQAVVGQMINAYWLTFSIVGAARLGVADVVEVDGPAVAVEKIAEQVGADPDALYRLLRGLTSAGIFREDDGRAFAHTPLSAVLRKDAPGSVQGLAAMTGMLHLRAWPDILHSLRTGETAFSKAFGSELFEYLAREQEAAAAFDSAFSGYTAMTSQAVVSGYDFSGYGTIVDVGGGSGALIQAILRRWDAPRGITFDLPHVAERARESLERSGLSSRAEAVGGDFFESVPPADCYTMKMIIHDWDDERSIAILKTLRRSITEGGRVCIIESVVPQGNTPSSAKLLDVNMLVMTGGQERTEAEYADLLARSGFRLTRVVPCGPTDVVEAEPV
jgi:hypothetical protein